MWQRLSFQRLAFFFMIGFVGASRYSSFNPHNDLNERRRCVGFQESKFIGSGVIVEK